MPEEEGYRAGAAGSAEGGGKRRGGGKPEVDAGAWLSKLDAYERQFSAWKGRAQKIVDRYRLHGSARSSAAFEMDEEGGGASFNALWANVQVLKPALFSRSPSVVAERRNRDQDAVGRIAAQVVERAANAEIESNGMKDAMDAVVLDNLLIGRGVPWVRFAADPKPPAPVEFDEAGGMSGPDGAPVDPASVVEIEGAPMVPQEGFTGERTIVDYVHWRDFLHQPARSWAEIEEDGWVARRVAMTRGEGVKRFGAKFRSVELTLTSRLDSRDVSGRSSSDGYPSGEEPRYAEVYEIWDRPTMKRIHVVRGMEEALEVEDDPYGLEKFFPCPAPAYGTMTNEDLVPTPDYSQYAALADELDEITRRIRVLVKALRLAGIFDASVPNLGRLLEAKDGEMIAVEGLQSIEGKGGIDHCVQYLPVEAAAEALQGLYEARARTQQTMYQISGVSDIVRGDVDPREKAAQSKIKAGFAGQRLNQRRSSIELCARGVARIIVEMAAELYSDEALREQSGFDLLPEVQQIASAPPAGPDGAPDPAAGPAAVEQLWSQVVQLIRDDRTRGFRIDVETDSTISLDADLVGEQRNQFMASVSGFLTNVMPAVAAMPPLMPAVGQLLLFTARGHRVGRQVEASLEQAVDKMNQMLQAQEQAAAQNQGQPPAEDPRIAAETENIKQEGQIKAAEAQQKAEGVARKQQAEQQKGEMGIQQQAQKMMLAQQQAEQAAAAAQQRAAMQQMMPAGPGR